MNSHQQSSRLLREHYNQPCKDLAVYLLGKILVRKLDSGTILKGKIIETESYLGGKDKASHSYNGKVTPRNKPMFMAPGIAYVYMLYFGYHCFNISSKEPGAVVLIRALEPISGQEIMHKYRVEKNKNYNRIIKFEKLCDGPSKLCLSFNITKAMFNKLDLADSANNLLWIEQSSQLTENDPIINCPRIGIGPSAEEWVLKPLRYYVCNNKSVSKRNKEAEKFCLLK